jgi:predicted Zn finger-like uncharacterized protein
VKISCPTCAAKYSVADEKIQSRLAKIRCRKCSSTIVIDGMTTPASVYIGDQSAPAASGGSHDAAGEGLAGRASGGGSSNAALAGAGLSGPPLGASEPVGPAADEYAVDIADNDQRNMTIHQIVGAYNEGLITADTYIWKEGMPDWQTLAEVKAVADALHAAARPVATAAVRRTDHGTAADLFGRIATAGSEDDITTSAPEPTFSAGTGARNESSVLFSLSALTGSGEATAAPAGGGKRRTPADDSGLIDLTALTAGEGVSGGRFGASASAFGASPLISAPLGGVSGPALGGGLAPSYGAPRSGGRTLMIAASLLAVAIIGGAALFVVNRNNADSEPTSALEPAPAAAPEKTPTREPAPEPIAQKPEPTPNEPASVKDSVSADDLPPADPEPSAKAPVVRAPAAPKPKPTPAAPVRAKPAPTPPFTAGIPRTPAPEPAAAAPAPKPAPAASEPAAEPAPKKKGRCECSPADLMCAMRCSAKK